jgi:hypothetical protein
MPYITSTERLAREEGVQEGIIESLTLWLEFRFGEDGLAFAQEPKSVTDLAKLRAVQQALPTAKTVEDLRQHLTS